jgi:hypothetical protein
MAQQTNNEARRHSDHLEYIMHNASQLRPRSVIELVDEAFRLYRRHVLTFIGIVAIVQVPMVIMRFLLEYVVGRDAALDVIRFLSQLTVARPGQNPFVGFPVSSFLIFFGITLGAAAFEGVIVQSLSGGALTGEIGLIIGLPLFYSIYTLLYYDLRIRSEGYDIEIRAQQVALP